MSHKYNQHSVTRRCRICRSYFDKPLSLVCSTFHHACHVSSSGFQCAIELDGQHLLLVPPADLISISKHLQLFRYKAHAQAIIFDVPYTGTNLHNRLTIFFAAEHLYLWDDDGNSATWRRSKAPTMNKRLQDRCIHPVQNLIDITYVIDHHGYLQREGRAFYQHDNTEFHPPFVTPPHHRRPLIWR